MVLVPPRKWGKSFSINSFSRLKWLPSYLFLRWWAPLSWVKNLLTTDHGSYGKSPRTNQHQPLSFLEFYPLFDWSDGRAVKKKFHRHLYVDRVDAQFSERFVGCFLKIQWQPRRTGFRVLHHGSCGGRSSCWISHIGYDLSKYPIHRYQCIKKP